MHLRRVAISAPSMCSFHFVYPFLNRKFKNPISVNNIQFIYPIYIGVEGLTSKIQRHICVVKRNRKKKDKIKELAFIKVPVKLLK